MNEQSDTLVKLIRDAAGQVQPLDGIDGDTMARRAIRRERVRRGAIGGVVTLVVVALVTVGGMVANGKQVLPAGWLFGDVPAGWTEVSGGGLTLAVPPGFEPFDAMGGLASAWGVDPEEDPMVGMVANSMVLVLPAPDDDPLSTGTYGPVVRTEVPGAVSAGYAWQTDDSVGDPAGVLDVELATGRTVRVMLVLSDASELERTFEQLVDTVRVDEDSDESEPAMPEDEQLTLDVVEELPADWEVQEHQGLRFAAPGDWVEDDYSAARDARWPSMSMNDEAGTFRLQATTHSTTFDDQEDSSSYMYLFDAPPGADRAGATLTEDGTLAAWIEVRRAGGRTYSIDIEIPAGADGERIVRTVAGSLEFTAEADDLPAYADLTDARTLIDAAAEIPEGWVAMEGPDFSLRMPSDWDVTEDDGSFTGASGPDAEESVTVWIEEPGVLGTGEVHVGGYRLDVPGAERAVVRMTDYSSYGEPESFDAFVEVRQADGSHVMVSFDGLALESEDLFWQILGTLEVDAP